MLRHGLGLLGLLGRLLWSSFSTRRCRVHPCHFVVIAIVAVIIVVVALLLDLVDASVDEDYHPFLEFVEKVFKGHGFARSSDLLLVFCPKSCGVML